jgi:hypothetical protein
MDLVDRMRSIAFLSKLVRVSAHAETELPHQRVKSRLRLRGAQKRVLRLSAENFETLHIQIQNSSATDNTPPLKEIAPVLSGSCKDAVGEGQRTLNTRMGSNMNRHALLALIVFIITIGPISPSANAQELREAGCTVDTVDCAAHEAGYEWASLNNVDSVDDCPGNSDSFIEGCQAYVAENQSDQGETSAPVPDETKKEEEGGSTQESPAKNATDEPD